MCSHRRRVVNILRVFKKFLKAENVQLTNLAMSCEVVASLRLLAIIRVRDPI